MDPLSKLELEYKRTVDTLQSVAQRIKTAPPSQRARFRNEANLLIQKRDMIMKQINACITQRSNLDHINMTVTNLAATRETVHAMANQTMLMKQQLKQLNIASIDALMDETKYQIEDAEELNSITSRPLGTLFVDEDELDRELAELSGDIATSSSANTLSISISDYLDMEPVAEPTPALNESTEETESSIPEKDERATELA